MLRVVDSLLRRIALDGFSLTHALELSRQWSCVVRSGSVGFLDFDWLVAGPGVGLLNSVPEWRPLIGHITEFVQQVGIHRREFAVRGWRRWLLEDPLVHPYRWLRPDLVAPAPFLNCDPQETVGGSGVFG